MNVDPDILYALRKLAADGKAQRVSNLKGKYDERTKQQFETQMQLLTDEVAKVVPPSHPMFDLVLTLAVIHKIERSQQEPEFVSDVEAGWPVGW